MVQPFSREQIRSRRENLDRGADLTSLLCLDNLEMLISSFWRWTYYKKTFYFKTPSTKWHRSFLPQGTWLLLFLLFFLLQCTYWLLTFSINQFYGISFYFDFWSSRQARQNELSTDPGSFAFLEAKIITSILQSWSFKIGYHMTILVKYCFFRIFRASRPCFEGHKNDLREPWHLKNRVNAFSSVNRSKICRQIDYTTFSKCWFFLRKGVIFTLFRVFDHLRLNYQF